MSGRLCRVGITTSTRGQAAGVHRTLTAPVGIFGLGFVRADPAPSEMSGHQGGAAGERIGPAAEVDEDDVGGGQLASASRSTPSSRSHQRASPEEVGQPPASRIARRRTANERPRWLAESCSSGDQDGWTRRSCTRPSGPITSSSQWTSSAIGLSQTSAAMRNTRSGSHRSPASRISTKPSAGPSSTARASPGPSESAARTEIRSSSRGTAASPTTVALHCGSVWTWRDRSVLATSSSRPRWASTRMVTSTAGARSATARRWAARSAGLARWAASHRGIGAGGPRAHSRPGGAELADVAHQIAPHLDTDSRRIAPGTPGRQERSALLRILARSMSTAGASSCR